MGIPSVREVIVVPFPFSDLSRSKDRPALIVAAAQRDEWVLCQITSTGQGDPHAISIGPTDFERGGLPHHSFVRPLKLFTVHERRIIRTVGVVSQISFTNIINSLIKLLRS